MNFCKILINTYNNFQIQSYTGQVLLFSYKRDNEGSNE